MATMNFSIPNEIKQAFNREFAGQNKSAIVAELMQQAVDRARQRRARHEAFAILTEERAQRGPLNGIQTRDAREAGRP
jgi:hypothetical protein